MKIKPLKIKPLNYFRCLLICLVSVLLCACQAGAEYIGKEDGTPYYESEAPEVLLVMNAMDGTVIG